MGMDLLVDHAEVHLAVLVDEVERPPGAVPAELRLEARVRAPL